MGPSEFKKNSNPNVSIFLYNSFVQNAFLGRREPITTNIPKPHINFGGTDTHDNLGGVGRKEASHTFLKFTFLPKHDLQQIACNTLQ